MANFQLVDLQCMNLTMVFDTNTLKWTVLPWRDSNPSGVCMGQMLAHSSQAILIGGSMGPSLFYSPNNHYPPISLVFTFDFATHQWSSFTAAIANVTSPPVTGLYGRIAFARCFASQMTPGDLLRRWLHRDQLDESSVPDGRVLGVCRLGDHREHSGVGARPQHARLDAAPAARDQHVSVRRVPLA